MPAYVTDATLSSPIGGLTARIYGLPGLCQGSEPSVNTFSLLRGRMPRSPGECLAEQAGNYLSELDLGDVLTVSSSEAGTGSPEDVFAVTEYTVVGIVSNPFYLSNERETTAIGQGGLSAILYADGLAYSLTAYTDAYIRLSFGSTLSSFSEEYEEKTEAAAEKLSSLGKVRSVRRYTEVLGEAVAGIQEAQETLNEERAKAEQEFLEAEEKIGENRRKLQSAKDEFALAKSDILEARNAYDLAYASFLENISSQYQAVTLAYDSVEEQQSSLERYKADVLDKEAEEVGILEEKAAGGGALTSDEAARVADYYENLGHYNGQLAALQEQKAYLDLQREQIGAGEAAGKAEFSRQLLTLEQGEAEIASAEGKLAASSKALERAEDDYRDKKEEAEEAFQQAQAEIDQAGLEIADISLPKWYVLDRNSNVSLVSFSRNVEKVDAVTDIFPPFFLLVTALVTITTMTRMVEQERTQIGTLKALGYTPAAIAAKYVIYCGSAGLLGSVAGVVFGFQLIPTVVWNVYASSFHLPSLTTYFSWEFMLIVSTVVLAATTLTTLSACYYALKDKPSLLMQPKAPKAGKRIFLERMGFLWSRLSFSYKATARNILRYKKHLFMTVIGVAGCTALMLAGFGIRDSLGDIAGTQFREIVRYDMEIWLDAYNPENRLLKGFLQNESVKGSMEVSVFEGSTEGREEYELKVLSVKDPGALEQFISLRDRKTGEPVSLREKQVVMTEMLAITLDLKPGDSFSITDDQGETGTFLLGAVTENYVDSYVYMTSDACSAAFGDHSVPNAYLVDYDFPDGESLGGAVSLLLNSKAVNTVSYVTETKATYENILSSMNFIVVVLIIAAGALAVIVLYNLININLEERQRELATLKVLGYHQGELAAYIFREMRF